MTKWHTHVLNMAKHMSMVGGPFLVRALGPGAEVMQRDSDTADSGKLRIVVYCVKRSMSKSVAVLPQV